jgi:two-component system, LuxR family, response regulator FixJ
MLHPRDFVICIVVHDDAVRDSICVLLDSMRFRTCAFDSANAFLRSERPTGKSCLLLDEDVSDMYGSDLLDRLDSEGLRTPAIIMTQGPNGRSPAANGRPDVVVLEKPFVPDKLIGCLAKALFPT